MGIYSWLESKVDQRNNGTDCLFNGFLEDYVGTLEDGKEKELFSKLLEKNNDFKIVVSYHMNISNNSISNSIIRYKDIYKLAEHAIEVPYIIYVKKDSKEKAIILIDDDYVYAEATYYALSEHDGVLKESRNDMIALPINDEEKILECYDKLFNESAGVIQRRCDKQHFKNYDELLDYCLKLSDEVKESINAIEKGKIEENFVKSCVRKWYLLKKFVYVQYMVDKNILRERHNGEIKQQRNAARENSEKIRFVSISEIWNSNKGDA